MLFLALVALSCDHSKNSTADESKQKANACHPEQSAKLSKKEMLDNQIEHTGFAYFEAVELPLASVLSKIEDEVNSKWAVLDVGKITFSAINSPSERITIVLKRVDLKTLLDLIDRQTLCQHDIDYDQRRIEFFSVTDTFGDDSTPSKVDGNRSGNEDPSVLPNENQNIFPDK
ncbi:MAG: hypothetical protein J0M04_25055 [Verrucomicrobia bacterium]|nr:hypothetical protein [Verrucomicrobiota bacterium]